MVAFRQLDSEHVRADRRHRQKASAAETTFRAKGLDPVIQNETEHRRRAGFVISTNPSPGSQVHKGQTITLDVGSGPSTAMVLVPFVEGFALKDAETLLKNAGFQCLHPGHVPRAERRGVHSDAAGEHTRPRKVRL